MSYLAPLDTDLAALSAKATSTHEQNLSSVDEIIARLERARAQLVQEPSGAAGGEESLGDVLLPLSSFVKQANLKSAEKAKEWGSAVSKFGKGVEKKFGAPPPPLFPPPPAPPATNASMHPSLAAFVASSSSSTAAAPSDPGLPFSSPTSLSALHTSLALHLARLGAFSSLDSFLAETGMPPPEGLEEGGQLRERLRELHGILRELREGRTASAIAWVEEQEGEEEEGELEYQLRREEFIRLLLSSSSQAAVEEGEDEPMDTDAPPAQLNTKEVDQAARRALAYGGAHFRRLMTPGRSEEICALLTSPLYLPLPRLLASPYGSLFSPYIPPSADIAYAVPAPTQALADAFAAAFVEKLGLPRDSPLSVVTDVGGSGALAKIMKVRQVMKEKKTEWSARGELPVEIPLPLRYRFHSVFACPVSKEQSTAANPPMLLPCGHVIAKESLARLARGTPTLKCPYCPVVSHYSACVRVHFG
ncbi:hypothetical protein JCM10213_007057 [Rhodosporidiobolus nylandii]